MYLAIKHSHLLFVFLSVVLFIVRFGWKITQNQMLEKKWVKVTPHVVDSLLLLSGIWLILITHFIPFTPAGEWMTEKLFCVLAYIVLGYIALHQQCGKLFRSFCFVGALGWVFIAASLAISKTPYN